MSAERVLVLQPPSPAFMNVMRDYAGGYGVARRSSRPDYGHEGGCVPYVSSIYAAAILDRDGYHVNTVDSQALGLSASQCLSVIEQFNPRIVISAVNLPSLDGDLAFLGMVRKILPSVDIIAVGTVCKHLYNLVLDSGCVAAVVRGDLEVVAPRLVPELLGGSDISDVPGITYRPEGSETVVTQNAEALKDLNGLPMPLYHQLPVSRYWEHSWGPDVSYMPVLDGRGCPYPCGSFCPYPVGFGRKPLYRNPELVVDEVEYLHKNFATQAFVFRNQNFTLNRKHAEGICREILRRGLHVRWLCETRLDQVDPEILRFMKSAGCELVHYGLESGDPELFESVGKPGSNLAEHGRMVQETKDAGMMPKLNVTIGLPGESWQTIRRTIQTIRQLKPDVVMATIITPYPGTKLFEDAERRGLLLTEDWSQFTGLDPVMRTEHLTPKELLRAQRMVDQCGDHRILPVRALRKARRLAGRAVRRVCRHG